MKVCVLYVCSVDEIWNGIINAIQSEITNTHAIFRWNVQGFGKLQIEDTGEGTGYANMIYNITLHWWFSLPLCSLHRSPIELSLIFIFILHVCRSLWVFVCVCVWCHWFFPNFRLPWVVSPWNINISSSYAPYYRQTMKLDYTDMNEIRIKWNKSKEGCRTLLWCY